MPRVGIWYAVVRLSVVRHRESMRRYVEAMIGEDLESNLDLNSVLFPVNQLRYIESVDQFPIFGTSDHSSN